MHRSLQLISTCLSSFSLALLVIAALACGTAWADIVPPQPTDCGPPVGHPDQTYSCTNELLCELGLQRCIITIITGGAGGTVVECTCR
jgi:hypothetical protein